MTDVGTIKWLKAVDGHPVGQVQTGVILDELVERWAASGLLEVTEREPAYTVPPKSAPKAAWQQFLTQQGVRFEPEDTRRLLIELWERHRG